jgi:transposase
MSKKTFRYRLYPTAAQRDLLDGHLRICCELYNAALQERRDAWRMARVSRGFTQQSAQLPALKVDRPDVAGVYSQVLQDVRHRVDNAFGRFFRRAKPYSCSKPRTPTSATNGRTSSTSSRVDWSTATDSLRLKP